MPIPPNDPPLIVTAQLGAESFAILDGMRQRYFPALLNKVPAHISLFHHLPGDAVADVVKTVKVRSRACPRFDLAPVGLRFLGRGVAIQYEGRDLHTLHAVLARDWAAWLTPQDRQPFKPHVTIQNKVAPPEARALFEAMKAEVLPVCRVEGVAIWRYLGGPWAPVATCLFAASSQSGATTA